jgi:hypothetical protein
MAESRPGSGGQYFSPENSLEYDPHMFYNEPIMKKRRTWETILSLLLVVLTTVVCNCGRGETGRELPILEIGKQDGSSAEFANKGFRDLDEFHCSTEKVPSADTFPLAHFVEGVVSDRGVSRVAFDLNFGEAYDRVVVRLAREGSETTVVAVDGKTEYQVTAKMLGSRDGNQFGVYDLQVGPLEKGGHTIVLTVLDDGKTTGGYAWDALKVLVR